MSAGAAPPVPAPERGRIELRLRTLDQLFDSFDPAPFHEKDLDRDAEEFVVGWAREYSPDTPLQFVLHLPGDQRRLDPERVVQDAVRNYFTYRSGLARLERRRTLQQGRVSLLVGLAFLASCMAARHLLRNLVGGAETAGDWATIVEEGLLIVGWVAMWRPVELLLYDWWPIRRRERTYANLARMQVAVRFTD